MEVKYKIDSNGNRCCTNFILKDVIDEVDSNFENKEEMIKNLTIQKIEYGIMCITQFLCECGENRKEMDVCYEKWNSVMLEKINEVKSIS